MSVGSELPNPEAGQYAWTFQTAKLEYLPDNDEVDRRFPLWPAIVEGEGLKDVSAYPEHVRRVSDSVSNRTKAVLDSSFDALVDKFILDYQRLKPTIEVAEPLLYMTNASVFALFDTLADAKGYQLYTPDKWADDCLIKLDKIKFTSSVGISEAVDVAGAIRASAHALVKHLTKPETAPSANEIFRYRDRWFSIETTPVGSIGVEPLRPLVILSAPADAEGQVLTPVIGSDLYINNGEIIFAFIDERVPEPDLHLTAEMPIDPDEVQQVGAEVIVYASRLGVADDPKLRTVNYGSDQLILRVLE